MFWKQIKKQIPSKRLNVIDSNSGLIRITSQLMRNVLVVEGKHPMVLF